MGGKRLWIRYTVTNEYTVWLNTIIKYVKNYAEAVVNSACNYDLPEFSSLCLTLQQ